MKPSYSVGEERIVPLQEVPAELVDHEPKQPGEEVTAGAGT